MAAGSTAWVCGRWLSGIGGSSPVGSMDVCRCEECVVEVSATG